MTGRAWQICPTELDGDQRFCDAIIALRQTLFERYFIDGPSIDPAMGFHIHAFRRTEDWRLLLLLTHWMLSRLLVPERDPGTLIPEDDWAASERQGSEPIFPLPGHGGRSDWMILHFSSTRSVLRPVHGRCGIMHRISTKPP